MTGIDLLSQQPLDYAQPCYLPNVLGIGNADLVRTLVECPPLRARLNARMETVLGEAEDLAIDDFAVLLEIVNADLDALERISRVLAVLVHAPSLGTSTDGRVLSLSVAHAGTREIMAELRNPDSPVFDCLPHTPHLTQELLDLYTQQVKRYLIGLVPTRLLQRVILRFPEGALPAPDSLDDRPADRAAFIRLAEIALDLLSARGEGAELTPDDAAQASDAAR